ncbi:MAG: hypothetical protein A2W80_12840 [Candidatus Riflebacteria bacterium GWC2_50_8]|nr:MAG: hypothetical protein A2W80_12840 [Candidatus Riflebacteria bacterium GWC2_50_8]
MRKKHFAAAVLLALLVACPDARSHGLELQPQLREAERLYQSGRYQDAAREADKLLKFFPDDLQALLVAGMSEYNSGNYLAAQQHFKRAHARSPRHPVVVEYVALLREIEYRSGSLSQNPQFQDSNNEYETARYFKRGYFGPGFTYSSASLPDPGIATAEVALPTPHPPVESIFKIAPVVSIAESSFAAGNYHKSYLFYSQLLAADPTNRRYLMGRAESAFHMKRFRQVIDMLGPLLAAPERHGFSEAEIEKARQLLSDARQKAFSGEP